MRLVRSTLSSYVGETEVRRGAPQQGHSGEPPDLLVPAILYACEGREVRGEAEALGEVGAAWWQLGPFRSVLRAGSAPGAGVSGFPCLQGLSPGCSSCLPTWQQPPAFSSPSVAPKMEREWASWMSGALMGWRIFTEPSSRDPTHPMWAPAPSVPSRVLTLIPLGSSHQPPR